MVTDRPSSLQATLATLGHLGMLDQVQTLVELDRVEAGRLAHEGAELLLVHEDVAYDLDRLTFADRRQGEGTNSLGRRSPKALARIDPGLSSVALWRLGHVPSGVAPSTRQPGRWLGRSIQYSSGPSRGRTTLDGARALARST
jgi:hypothetical protein